MTSPQVPALPDAPPPTLPPLNTEQQRRLVLPNEPWSDQRALDTVRKDFLRAEAWRIFNYDRSLRRNDDVYYAVTRVKTWEGTRIPRATVPIWMAARHVQAIHAHWMQALFADDYPCEVLPEAGTTMEQAFAVREILRSYMENMNPDIMGMTAREIFSRSAYSALVYGCGPIEIGWAMKQMKRQVFSRRAVPEMMPMQHPLTGETVMVSSGQLRWDVVRGEKTYTLSRPKAQNILVYDWYVDPNSPSTNPQESGYVCTRQLLPIWYLKDICLPEFGFKLPEKDEDWANLIGKYKQTMAEVTASWGELARGNYYNRSIEQTADLASQRVEVVRYWNNHRNVWLLGRDFLAYNQPNELGIKPFVNNYYIPAPGRPYSISVCDILEGEQMLTQKLVEGRLDEVNIKLHPPVVRTLGTKIATSQRRLRPGVEWEVPNDATKDIALMQMGDVLPSAYVEAQASDIRAQQTTGANDVAAMGTGTAGGNSANRTATGISTQNAAFSSRIQALVENCEDQSFAALLRMIFLMAQKYGDPNVPMLAGSQTIDPLDVMNAQVRFKIKASDKLRIRRAAASGVFEAFVQQLAAISQQLQATGETFNWKLVGQLVADGLGVPQSDFIVPMSPQQQQAMMQMRMAPELMKMQMQTQRMDAMSQMNESKDDAALLAKVFTKLLTPEVVALIARENGAPEVLDLLKKKVEKPPKQLPARAHGRTA